MAYTRPEGRDGFRGTLASSAPAAHAVAPRRQPVGVTLFGCDPDEAGMVRRMAPALDLNPVITPEDVSSGNIELVAGNRCISVGHKTRITQALLEELSSGGVEYVSTRSVGVDHIDSEFAGTVDIRVESVAYSPGSVADYTVMLMLMSLRHVGSTLSRLAVLDYRLNAIRGRDLADLTVGVIGVGRIGAAVVQRLQGFGCRVTTYDQRRLSRDAVPLEELLHGSDVVSLHVPLTASTHHLLDRQRFAQMRAGAVLINTARGALVDTDALIGALETGHLGGAALDVLEGEEGVFYVDHRDRPVRNERLIRLQQLPNVIITPHTAYYTRRALRDTVENSLRNCLRFEAERNA